MKHDSKTYQEPVRIADRTALCYQRNVLNNLEWGLPYKHSANGDIRDGSEKQPSDDDGFKLLNQNTY